MARNIESNTLSLTASHSSLTPDINLTVTLTDVSSLSSLADQIKLLRESSNQELSVWVEVERNKGETDRKRGISEGDLSEGEDTAGQNLDADIDSILSAHNIKSSQVEEEGSKAKKIKN